MDFHRKTLRALNRPKAARTAADEAELATRALGLLRPLWAAGALTEAENASVAAAVRAASGRSSALSVSL
jgi:hypothetical protein